MTYDQFVQQWSGKPADFDGYYGDQCVDLFNFYNRDVVGQDFDGTPTTGGAADLWNDYQTLPGYTKVPNSPTGVPPKGAVVVWAANTKATGSAGHVGIASGAGDTTYFVSFDQNYPTGSLPHLQHHTYDGVLGWYVPNNQGDEEVKIGPEDNWFWRFNKLMQQIRGREISRDEFNKNFVGVDDFHMVEILSDDPEADAALTAQSVGQVAVRDNWDTQIHDLQAQAQGQQTTIDQLNTQLKTTEAALEAAKALPAPQTPTSTTPAPTTPQTAPTQSPAWLAPFVDWIKSLVNK